MTLWIVFALMTAVAALAVLWPLARGREAARAGTDVAVYRDQLDEIERDRAAGTIGAAEAEAARIEVSRRLLAAVDAAPAGSAKDVVSRPLWRRRFATSTALVVLPLGAAAFYLMLGSPHLPGQPLAERIARAHEANQSIVQLVARVEAHLEKNPDDGRGWEVIAPVYVRMGRFDEAIKARRNVLRLLGATGEREAYLGEALMGAANGVVTAEAKATFDRALKLEPQNVAARYYLGLAAEQDGRRADAAKIWRELLASAPPGAPWVSQVRQVLARVEGPAPPSAQAPAPTAPETPLTTVAPSSPADTPGPSAQDVAAASQMTPEQRQEMIRGMVARLAERLKADGSDVEGWLRLVRSYVVLGERDKALAAAADARRALAGDSDKLRRLDELVKGLGLAS